jgi:RimJ/RimL family protein N-acetyltransferase
MTAADFRAALARYRGGPNWAGFAIIGPAEISYWLAPSARGRGLATRAVVEMCARLGERHDLALWTHAGNTASQRVAERAGFHYRPDRDEQRTVGTQTWPARWYIRTSGPAPAD